MSTDALREALVYWPAWDVLVAHLSREHPADACPRSIYGSAMAVDHDRLTGLLFGNGVGDDMAEARDVLHDLLLMAQDGARPRFGWELGLFASVPAAFALPPVPAQVHEARRVSGGLLRLLTSPVRWITWRIP